MAKRQKRSLAALKETLKNEDNNKGKGGNGGFFYPFWNLPKDKTSSLRIAEDPNLDNDFIVHIEHLEHTLDINGERHRIPCLKNWGEECPICKLSQDFYSKNNDKKGKYYYRNKYLLLRGIVTDDGLHYENEEDETSQDKVVNLKFSFQLAEKLKSEIGKFRSDDPDFWDLDEGFDFTIEKQIVKDDKNKDMPNYILGSGFERRSSALTDAQREAAESITEPLEALRPNKMEYDEVWQKLQQHLSGGTSTGSDASDSSDDSSSSDDDLMNQISRNRRGKSNSSDKPKKDEVPDDDDDDDDNIVDDIKNELEDDDDDDDDDILSQIVGD